MTAGIDSLATAYVNELTELEQSEGWAGLPTDLQPDVLAVAGLAATGTARPLFGGQAPCGSRRSAAMQLSGPDRRAACQSGSGQAKGSPRSSIPDPPVVSVKPPRCDPQVRSRRERYVSAFRDQLVEHIKRRRDCHYLRGSEP